MKPSSTAASSSLTPLLSAREISKAFGGVQAVSSVSFEVFPGEVHAIIGENGAGKSTFAKILTGLVQPDAGQLYIRGEPVDFKGMSDAERAGISAIQQELILVPHLSVAQNMVLEDPPPRGGRLGRAIGWLDKGAAIRQARAALEGLDVQVEPKTRAGSLGASQAQMVLIARALSRQMQILILDEPTAALSPKEADELKKKLRLLQQSGVALIYISHRLHEVLEIADRITVFRDGQWVATVDAGEANVDQLVELMLARRLQQMYPKREFSVGNPVLKIKNITRDRALRDVSLTVRAGEIVGVTGLIGAGKTELARAIVGADRIEAGTVHVHGVEVKTGSPNAAIKRGIGLVPEDRKSQGLMLPLSVHENLAIPFVNAPSSRRRDHPTVGADRRPSRLKPLSNDLTRRFGIRLRSIDQPAGELSGGNQQKVAFAKWFPTAPSVMILDEPTRGIDVGSKVEIFQAIEDMAEQGVAILMLSSEVQEVLEMCDRILVMREGRVVAEFQRGEATESQVMRAAVAEIGA